MAVPPHPATESWQTSRVSGGTGECVQVMRTRSHVWIRDSKNPDGPVLGLTQQDWTVFLGAVRRGEFTGAGLPA